MSNDITHVAEKLRGGAIWRWDVNSQCFQISSNVPTLLGVDTSKLHSPADIVRSASVEGVTDQNLSNKEQISDFINGFEAQIIGSNPFELTFLTHDRKRLLWLRAEHKLDLETNTNFITGELDDITNLLRSARHATEQARVDEMSGLLRREPFIQTMKEWIQPNPKLPTYFFVYIALDLDGLSIINNHYGGHAAGDDVIRSFGKRLQGLQSQDIIVGRMGGDEFSVFARCQTTADFEALLNSVYVQSRYPHTFASHVVCPTRQIQVSAAIGVASRPSSNSVDADILELMRQADDACYISKKNKDQQYIIFNPQMKEDIERELSNRLVLTESLRDSNLPLAWMPIVNLKSGLIVGAEVLLDDVTRDMMGAKSNEEVIKSLRDLALLEDHDLGNLFHAMQEIASINQGLPDNPLYLSVNLSPTNLVSPNNSGDAADGLALPSTIVKTIESLMKWTSFPPSLLHIEISEDAPLDNTIEVQATLSELKRLGVKLVCDDFGKNYSNLERLFLFPEFDIYKLDMILTQQLVGSNDRNRQAVIQIIEVLRGMGKEICAEGVEHVEQYLRLKNAGCESAQGFLFTYEKGRSGGKLSTAHFREIMRDTGVFHWIHELE